MAKRKTAMFSKSKNKYFHESLLRKKFLNSYQLCKKGQILKICSKNSLIQTNYLLYFQVSLGLGRYEPLLIDPYEELHEQNSLSIKDKFSKLVLSTTDTEMTDHTLRDLLPDDRYFRFNPYLSGE